MSDRGRTATKQAAKAPKMPSSKEAFISAPNNIDTRPIREAFEAKGVKTFSPDQLDVGGLLSDVLQEGMRRADFIVAPSGSCTAMARNFYGELFSAPEDEGWRARLAEVRPRLREFSEFVVRELGVEDVGARFKGRATYHDACHLLRELGVADEPRRLIRAVRNVEFVEMEAPDTCCGFGGTFSVKYAEISDAILREKIARIERSGADYVVANDASCLMQIAG